MFERAIKDACFVKRWTITRNLRDQTIAEHSWCVAMYANDICEHLGLDYEEEYDGVQLRVLQYALWHDSQDEVFTGDLPGPNKRELVTDKPGWKKALAALSDRVFKNRLERSGMSPFHHSDLICQIVKLADWLEAAIEDATEMQLGNLNREVHFIHDSEQVFVESKKLRALLPGMAWKMGELDVLLSRAIVEARHGQSPGPVMAAEMRGALETREHNRLARSFHA